MSHVLQCRLHCSANPSLPVVVKIVSKLQILQQGKVQSIMNEKAALQRLGPHPYIARLYGTSQSEDELYFVLEWLPHGDLLQHIRRVHAERVRAYHAKGYIAASPGSTATRQTSIPRTSSALRCLDFHDIQLITAQLILALARASAEGIVLRDLKPENVAFDEKYRACLLDFDTVDLDGAAVIPESNNGVACPPSCSAAADAAEDEPDNQGRPPRANLSSAATNCAMSATDEVVTTKTSAPSTPLGDASSASAASSSAPPRRRLTVSEIQSMRKKSASFCGTAQYVSPEMVGECKWSFSSDLWALGALVYEMAYGTHLFAGLSQFEVLQKVIQGNYVGSASLFPPINFEASGSRDATEEGSSSCSSFAALKDFIQQLLNIDPSKRLGVNPNTHRFDEAALRGHALFTGFAWERVDAQLRTFRARSFSTSAAGSSGSAGGSGGASSRAGFGQGRSPFDIASEQRRDSASEEEENDTPDEAAITAAAAAAQAALEALGEASVDPSPSLAADYHSKPFNDLSYAEYVYRATADANPFEKLFVCSPEEKKGAAAGEEDGNAEKEAATSSKGGGGYSTASCPKKGASDVKRAVNVHIAAAADTPAASSPSPLQQQDAGVKANKAHHARNADEEDDVIDDVGMRYVGSQAHPDFQE
jgi:serine/threonine protein kinase